ncbi:unnamed protein product [Rhizophagus irregularis]|nr:unnamed protein product [Rhizophagus irregularis]
MAKIGSRSPPPFGASPPAFGFRVWIGRWLSLQADGSGFHYRIGGFPPLELYWMGGFPPWNFIGWAGFPPLELYWMGGFPLTNWGFPPSDFIGLVSPSDFIRSGFLRIFIRLGEDDG